MIDDPVRAAGAPCGGTLVLVCAELQFRVTLMVSGEKKMRKVRWYTEEIRIGSLDGRCMAQGRRVNIMGRVRKPDIRYRILELRT